MSIDCSLHIWPVRCNIVGLIIVKLIESDIGITQNQISDNADVNIPWVKETQLNVGVLVKNLDVYFVGCPSHIAHNARRNREDSFSRASGFVRWNYTSP